MLSSDRQKTGNNRRLVVGIDASRNRSGGAKAHIIGILSEGVPHKFGIDEVHIWSYKSLLNEIPDFPWLVKHNPPELDKNILKQLWWQRFRLPFELRMSGCSIVLNTDAGTIGRFSPSVTMSRDMLSYEPGEIERFGVSKARLRLILLRYMQNRTLQVSDGVIFLTEYAAKVIQQSCGKRPQVAIIPHGIGHKFHISKAEQSWPDTNTAPMRCLYVSNVALYKHQWIVVKAMATLRQRGFNVQLVLVGAGPGSGASRAQTLLDNEISTYDPEKSFVTQAGYIPHNELPSLLASSDLFIFASSCENMPNSLVEAMAVGLPIACSNRGPMPEVLKDGGVYFNPEDQESIAWAVARIITDEKLRLSIARRAKELSEQYSWARCSAETWNFVREIASN